MWISIGAGSLLCAAYVAWAVYRNGRARRLILLDLLERQEASFGLEIRKRRGLGGAFYNAVHELCEEGLVRPMYLPGDERPRYLLTARGEIEARFLRQAFEVAL